MTLTEIASFICSKHGKTDNTSISLCKDYIKNWYKFIWEKHTWNDSKTDVSDTFSASTANFTVDSTVDIVVEVIYDGTKLEEISLEKLYEISPEWTTATGTPAYYFNRPKSGGDCVIRLNTLPTEDKAIVIIGKLVFTQLTGDSDSPLLRGIDNTLIALAESTFLQRMQQFGSAQIALNEGMAMLNKMIEIETNQQTKHQRIQPKIYDVGYKRGYS